LKEEEKEKSKTFEIKNGEREHALEEDEENREEPKLRKKERCL
jgi:hypothetical protein